MGQKADFPETEQAPQQPEAPPPEFPKIIGTVPPELIAEHNQVAAQRGFMDDMENSSELRAAFMLGAKARDTWFKTYRHLGIDPLEAEKHNYKVHAVTGVVTQVEDDPPEGKMSFEEVLRAMSKRR